MAGFPFLSLRQPMMCLVSFNYSAGAVQQTFMNNSVSWCSYLIIIRGDQTHYRSISYRTAKEAGEIMHAADGTACQDKGLCKK